MYTKHGSKKTRKVFASILHMLRRFANDDGDYTGANGLQEIQSMFVSRQIRADDLRAMRATEQGK